MLEFSGRTTGHESLRVYSENYFFRKKSAFLEMFVNTTHAFAKNIAKHTKLRHEPNSIRVHSINDHGYRSWLPVR